MEDTNIKSVASGNNKESKIDTFNSSDSSSYKCDKSNNSSNRSNSFIRPFTKTTPWSLLLQLAYDWGNHRGSLLLLIVFWPIALFMIVQAQCERIWRVGSVYFNLSHLVSEDDNEVMDLLLSKSGVELSNRIRDVDDPLTSVKLVTAYINQIKRTNIFINAVVAERFNEAISEAQAVDNAISKGFKPSNECVFYGVPFLVKECFEVKGLPYTAGIVGRHIQGITGMTTATAVQQVAESGAIILASTNVSEGCMWHESYNQVYGRTNNPYDLGRTAGGSSGGCGAGVSSCMSAVAITSDVGGSTRIPSFYNCLFGHKPTGGSISNDKTIPEVGEGGVRNFCQLGCVSRHSEDIWPLFNLLVKKNVEDRPLIQKIGDLSAVDNIDFSSLTVYYSKKNLGNSLLLSSLHQEIVIGIGRCTDHLSSLGSKVEQFTAVPEIFDGLNAFQYWSALMSSEKKEPFSVTIRDGSTPFSSFWHMLLETAKSIAGISIHTFPAMLLSLAEIFVARTPSLTAELAAVAKRVKSVLCEYLKGNKVLIIPSLPSYAPLHNESILRIFDTANTSFFNVAELPATAVPLGLDARGMPIGLQVIAAPGNDYLTIAVAKALQKGGIAKWMAPKSHI